MSAIFAFTRHVVGDWQFHHSFAEHNRDGTDVNALRFIVLLAFRVTVMTARPFTVDSGVGP